MREVGRRLAGIELRRPLAAFAEPERSTTAAARTWFEETLLHASHGASSKNVDASTRRRIDAVIIEHSVYPDLADPPDSLPAPEDRADYVARICGAWDFGIVPARETFELFRGWRDVFDAFPIYASPAFAAFRMFAGWEALADNVMQRAEYEDIDARDRGPDYVDPCASLV